MSLNTDELRSVIHQMNKMVQTANETVVQSDHNILPTCCIITTEIPQACRADTHLVKISMCNNSAMIVVEDLDGEEEHFDEYISAEESLTERDLEEVYHVAFDYHIGVYHDADHYNKERKISSETE